VGVHGTVFFRVKAHEAVVDAHVKGQLIAHIFQVNDAKGAILALAQLGDHAHSLVPTVGIKRAVVDHLDDPRKEFE